jgi:hypothetical protein
MKPIQGMKTVTDDTPYIVLRFLAAISAKLHG